MSSSSDIADIPLFSHPGKPLSDHLRRVAETGLRLFRQKKGLTLPWPHEMVEELLIRVLIFHDAGKMTPWFQRMLNRENGWERDKFHRLTEHGLVSSLIAAFQTYSRFSAHPAVWTLVMVAMAAVRRHHGNLANLEKLLEVSASDWQLMEKQLPHIRADYFRRHFSGWMDIGDYCSADLRRCAEGLYEYRLDMEDAERGDVYLFLNFVYSLLVYSDKYEAIFSRGAGDFEARVPADITDRYRERVFNKKTARLSDMRDAIYRETAASCDTAGPGERVFSIHAPTGSGKTLNALNAALRLREQFPGVQRIIYCLPFTSVIDQNADVFAAVLATGFETLDSDLFTKQHHLSDRIWIGKDGDVEYEGDEAGFLVETWGAEIVATTFWQLFHTLFSGDNGQLRKFHNMACSVIILDEVQSVPARYWRLIRGMAPMFARMFNSVFVLVTATMPLIFREERREIRELAVSREAWFRGLDRVCLTVDLRERELADFAAHVSRRAAAEPDRRFLFILNTIASSRELRRLLADLNPLYLSTAVIPKRRLAIIKDIRAGKGRVLVSTQLVEAGVDIDFDVVYRDLAPLDGVNQAAGRCNRENRRRAGEVILVSLLHDGKQCARSIYDPHLLEATRMVLRDETVLPESRFYDIAAAYYRRVEEVISGDKSGVLLKTLSMLNYGDAFTGKDAFRLIDNDYLRVNVFVEADGEASAVLARYREIYKIADRWERKSAFADLRAGFSQYVISVSENQLKKNIPPTLDFSDHYWIPRDQLAEYYDEETGFKSEGGSAIW